MINHSILLLVTTVLFASCQSGNANNVEAQQSSFMPAAGSPISVPAGPGNANLDIPYPDPRRISPIPQAEIQANPGLADDQNEGY